MQKHVRTIVAVLAAALAVTAVAAASLDHPSRSPAESSALVAARNATARFQSLTAAKKAGYGLLKDKNGIACIAMDMPGMTGAMGVHYANPTLVGDGQLDSRTPEAVVYRPLASGKLRLGAVEYVVLQSAWKAHHASPPVMFGHQFNSTPAGNRYGLPAFYSLHVWLFKYNRTGEFSMWNPDVNCVGAGR
jgi:hypothetical protein